VNKKKQKNSIGLVNCEASPGSSGTNWIRVFCFLFSKKKILRLRLTCALTVGTHLVGLFRLGIGDRHLSRPGGAIGGECRLECRACADGWRLAAISWEPNMKAQTATQRLTTTVAWIRLAGLAPGNGTDIEAAELTACGSSATRPTATVLEFKDVGGQSGRELIKVVSLWVAPAADSRAKLAASCQGSRPSRANAERTLMGMPFSSSPSGAKRNLSNVDPRGATEAQRLISTIQLYGFIQDVRPVRAQQSPDPRPYGQTGRRGRLGNYRGRFAIFRDQTLSFRFLTASAATSHCCAPLPIHNARRARRYSVCTRSVPPEPSASGKRLCRPEAAGDRPHPAALGGPLLLTIDKSRSRLCHDEATGRGINSERLWWWNLLWWWSYRPAAGEVRSVARFATKSLRNRPVR